MIEINAAVFILIVECLVGVSITLLVLLVVTMRSKKRRRAAIAQLVAQIKKQSEVRTNETGSFLQEIYQLEGDDLKVAIDLIDKGEKLLFQKLINSYLNDDVAIITAMDASVAELIDIYKELKPKVEEVDVMPESESLLKQIEELTNSNNSLKDELGITKTTMGNMIDEFGNMFGGGADHELANFEVAEKVGAAPEVDDSDVDML